MIADSRTIPETRISEMWLSSSASLSNQISPFGLEISLPGILSAKTRTKLVWIAQLNVPLEELISSTELLLLLLLLLQSVQYAERPLWGPHMKGHLFASEIWNHKWSDFVCYPRISRSQVWMDLAPWLTIHQRCLMSCEGNGKALWSEDDPAQRS